MKRIKIIRNSMRTAFLSLIIAFCIHPLSAWAVPRPEHPRPDAFRENWVTLNGEWQFEIDQNSDGEARGLTSGKDLAMKITVPFCPESKLSGVAHYGIMKHTWYRRFFEVPAAMQGKRVLLHFDAVDYQAWVWLNGQPVGSHIGGSVPFSFDLTQFLHSGSNELVVHVFDDVASGRQPTGKQTHGVSHDCFYTRTTGIWQSVWLEAVGSSFVENFSITPDPDHSRQLLDVSVNGCTPDLQLTATAFANGKQVGSDSSLAAGGHQQLVVNLNTTHLWSPDDPFLYDLKFTLSRGSTTVDQVASYFGLRKVSVDGRSILINGKRIFQRLILDQGFYPAGIWTAPSDEELKKDIERSMAAGFNGARLHQKVFEPRYLYWADKLGYLVWGEFPSWGFDCKSEDYVNFINEWTEVLMRDRNHPSIIGWCPFNESTGKAAELQQVIWRQTRLIDPTRPVLETSGWPHTVPGAEVRDYHDYDQNVAHFQKHWSNFFAGTFAMPARYNAGKEDLGVPFMLSEFGGIGWNGTGYGNNPKSFEEFYTRYEGLVNAQLDNPNLFGFCYTQLTDVEQEKNGLYYYDRSPKFDLSRIHSITARRAAYETVGPAAPAHLGTNALHWQVLVPAVPDGNLCAPYRCTTNNPPDGWAGDGFKDTSWRTAPAPFGSSLPGVRTPWKVGDLWLRRTFDCANVQGLKSAALVIFYEQDTEVFINGQRVWHGEGYLGNYGFYSITDAFKKAVKQGENTLAIHAHSIRRDSRFVDLALLCKP